MTYLQAIKQAFKELNKPCEEESMKFAESLNLSVTAKARGEIPPGDEAAIINSIKNMIVEIEKLPLTALGASVLVTKLKGETEAKNN